MRAVVELAMFLELSDAATVDDASAVEQLDRLANLLQELPDVERAQLLFFVEETMLPEARAARDADRAAYLRGFADSFGLVPLD